jgi:predicted transcriptional regulator
MGKNRDRVSIIAAILEAVNLGATKTRIMFNANLSFKLLEKYLNICIFAGFVRVERSNYKLTSRGQEYLKHYRLFEERYMRAQRLLEALDCERERLSQPSKLLLRKDAVYS